MKNGVNFVVNAFIDTVAVCAFALSNTITGFVLPGPQHSGLTFDLHSSRNLLNWKPSVQLPIINTGSSIQQNGFQRNELHLPSYMPIAPNTVTE